MSRRARRLRAAVLAAGGASAMLAGAGPFALLPFVDVARAAADSSVAVAFVVDFGGGAGAVVGCVRVPSGTNGYQALADFTTEEQEQAPTYNASQLLCSINGIPSSGCGQSVANGYVYWSYWHGTPGTWQYADTGAFATVQPGDVEGWRFENPGKGNPTDPAPRVAPDYAAICGATVAATTTTAPPATPGGGGPPTGQAAGTPGPASSTGSTGATGSAGPGGAGPSGIHGPTTTVPRSSVASGGSPSSAPTTGTSRGSHAQSLRAVDAATTHPAANGAVPVAVGAGLVAVLAGLAFWRWRKRPRMP